MAGLAARKWAWLVFLGSWAGPIVGHGRTSLPWIGTMEYVPTERIVHCAWSTAVDFARVASMLHEARGFWTLGHDDLDSLAYPG